MLISMTEKLYGTTIKHSLGADNSVLSFHDNPMNQTSYIVRCVYSMSHAALDKTWCE